MTQRRAAWLFAALFVLCPTAAPADDADEFIAAQLKQRRIPGLSVAVCVDGKLVKAKGYGLANVEHEVPAKPETIYQSGSVGKQFTSMAVMMLVEDGKLGLDDPISRYFDEAPEHWKPITVRHLLTHTAGVKSYTGRD